MFSCGGYVCWGGRHLSSSLHRTDRRGMVRRLRRYLSLRRKIRGMLGGGRLSSISGGDGGLVWRTADSRNPPPFPRGNARLQRQKQQQHRGSQSQQVTSSVRHRKQRRFPLGKPSAAIDLKDGEEALVEVVKVGPLEVVVAEAVAAVEVGAEDLEAEHGEDAHDEEEEEEERGDRLDAVRQRLEQVREVPPVPTGGVGARSVGI